MKFVVISLIAALAWPGLAAAIGVNSGDAATSTVGDAGQPAGIRLLIGGDDIRATDHAAIIRIGPANADWSASDAQDPVTCLAQAVYYEARSESLDGQHGVAQVVINRTHSGLFPTDVCGVVFQRSAAGTCQFSFACDGSMDRPIEPAAWDRARAIADQTLHGFVYKPLKDATHFHAAWMMPYWGPSLTRIRQIGGHIFYR